MCEFLIFNTQKRYEKQKNFGNFSATFWQLLDTFIGNFFGIHRQLVAKPNGRTAAKNRIFHQRLFFGLVFDSLA